jgi:hypothetical protein
MRKLDVRSNLNIADIVRNKNLKETHLHYVLRRVLLFIPVMIWLFGSLLTSRELEVLQLLVEAKLTKRTASSFCLGVILLSFIIIEL